MLGWAASLQESLSLARQDYHHILRIAPEFKTATPSGLSGKYIALKSLNSIIDCHLAHAYVRLDLGTQQCALALFLGPRAQ